MRAIARAVWNASEHLGIGLGRFAPWVFGAMVGAIPRHLDQHNRKDGE